MKYQGLLTLAVLFTILPFAVNAETVLRTGSDISVESDQVVEGDYYVSVGLLGKTTMSGNVAEDMYAVGQSVTINGEVGQDLSALAGVTHIHAPVADDVRIVGGEVTLADEVGGDVFVIGASLSILSTANIGGDVFFFGGDVTIEGDVAGSIHGTAQRVSIDSVVGGGIDMSVPGGLTLGDNARIVGPVTYSSFGALSRGQGTVIEGEVLKKEYTAMTAREEARGVLIPIFITLFATLSLYLLFKRQLESLVQSIDRSFARTALIGSGIILFGPVISILLMVTVLGLFIGLLTFSAVLMLYVAGLALASVVLGAYVTKLFTKELSVTLTSILIGTVALQGILIIPVLGFVCIYILLAVTIGGIAQRIYQAAA